jgi:CBS domain containing-hemolysin-like protein
MAEAADPALTGWLAAIALILAGLLIVLAALLERSGPIRLRHFAEEAGGRLRLLSRAPRRFEAFRYLLSFLAKALPTVACLLVAALLVGLGVEAAVAVVAAFAVLLALLLVVEWANRALVGGDPEGALRRFTGLYRWTYLALAPLVVVVAPLLPAEPAHAAEEEEDEASDEEIEAFIAVGTREGILEPDEGDLVRGVVDFGATQVRSVMTPRIDIVGAPVESTLDELGRRFIESFHSRIPLYRDSVDHVVGILHIRDLLQGLFAAGRRPKAGELAKPAYFVPVTKPIDELLRELQARQQQMAMVVDEYGGTAGLVTVEDLVEEIVGDIADEHEESEEPVQALPDGSWRVDGRTHLEELEDLVGVELAEGPYETVGGLILSILGEVPEFGAVVEAQGLRMTVEKVSERRIETVRVERPAAPEERPR